MTGITSVAKKTVQDLAPKHLSALAPSKRAAFTLAEVFSPHCAGRRKIAFTLAEVLITVGIIGVVAAITIPTLISKYQEKQTVTRFKWVYSTLSNAYTMAVLENGSPKYWELNTSQDMAEMLSKYTKVTKKCYYKSGCLPRNMSVDALTGETRYGLLGTNAAGSWVVFVNLPNGVTLWFNDVRNGCDNNYCGNIIAFISYRKVNRLGLDRFNFYITPDGIFPYGYNWSDAKVKANCTKNYIPNAGCNCCNGETCGEWIRRWNNAKYWYN